MTGGVLVQLAAHLGARVIATAGGPSAGRLEAMGVAQAAQAMARVRQGTHGEAVVLEGLSPG